MVRNLKVNQRSGINYGIIPLFLLLKTNELLIWLQELILQAELNSLIRF